MQVLKSNVKRAGLTLIELIVVLFILAALAGIALALLPNFQKKTHGSTSAASIRAAESAITANLITGGVIGNGFDGLVTTGGAVPDYIGDGATFTALDPSSVSGLEDALAELGITGVYPAEYADRDALITAEANATLEGHNYTAASLANVAELTGAGIAQVEDNYNLATTPSRVIAFGLGQECTLVGLNKAFKEAPLHTPGEGSAATTYGRLIILVGFDAATEEASYIGVVGIDDGEFLNSISGHLGEFFEASNE